MHQSTSARAGGKTIGAGIQYTLGFPVALYALMVLQFLFSGSIWILDGLLYSVLIAAIVWPAHLLAIALGWRRLTHRSDRWLRWISPGSAGMTIVVVYVAGRTTSFQGNANAMFGAYWVGSFVCTALLILLAPGKRSVTTAA